MATTRSGSSGNGFVAWSLASTSMTVVSPRRVIAESETGFASGRVDGTTCSVIRPGSPWLIASRTESVMAVVAPLTADSFARSTSR